MSKEFFPERVRFQVKIPGVYKNNETITGEKI